MNNDLSIYTIDDILLNKITSIIYKIARIEKNILNKNHFSKIDPYKEIDFLKYQIRHSDIESQFIFKYPNSNIINELINNLFNWLNNTKTKTHPLIYIPIFLYGLIYIHPFEEKNDTIIKGWLKLLLVDYSEIFLDINLPENFINNKNFYNVINLSFKNNTTNEFIIYFLNILDDLLNDYIDNEKVIINDSNIKLNKLLKVMEEKKPMSAFEIMQKLNIKSKETFRNSYLNLAIKKGIIFKTIPDKPTSKNQMYYKI